MRILPCFGEIGIKLKCKNLETRTLLAEVCDVPRRPSSSLIPASHADFHLESEDFNQGSSNTPPPPPTHPNQCGQSWKFLPPAGPQQWNSCSLDFQNNSRGGGEVLATAQTQSPARSSAYSKALTRRPPLHVPTLAGGGEQRDGGLRSQVRTERWGHFISCNCGLLWFHTDSKQGGLGWFIRVPPPRPKPARWT